MKKAIAAAVLAVLLVFLGQSQVKESLMTAVRSHLPPKRQGEQAVQQEPLFSQGAQRVGDLIEVTLYYRYGRTDVLGIERCALDIRREETVARSIVDRLVAGPDGAHGQLSGVFAHDTQVLSVTSEGTTAHVTLSEAFLGRPDGAPDDWEDQTAWQQEAALRRWLAAQSIVCSLTEGGRYQRVQLYVARSDDDVPERIPLYWFDTQVRDATVVLAACSRDEQVILTPQRAMRMVLDGWQRQDWPAVYALLCADEGEQLPTLSAFEARMREADVSLLTAQVSGGTIDAAGTTATLVLDGAVRSNDGGDAQIIRESVPLVREADNWAMRLGTLTALMLRD